MVDDDDDDAAEETPTRGEHCGTLAMTMRVMVTAQTSTAKKQNTVKVPVN